MSDSLTGKPSLLEEVRASLEGLKRTHDGAMLFRLIERGLARYDTPGGRMEDAYMRFLYTLLDRFAGDSAGNPVTRVKARLIQQRLTPHVDLERIKRRVKRSIHSPVLNKKPPKPNVKVSKTVETVLTPAKISLSEQQNKCVDSGIKTKSTLVDQQVTKEEMIPDKKERAPAGIDAIEVPGILENINEKINKEKIYITPEPGPVPKANKIDSSRIEQIQEELESNISDTVSRNMEFNRLLKSNLKALELAENADDLMDLKQLLVRGLQDLVQGQEVLDSELAQTNHYIQEVRQDRQRLKNRVEKLSKHGVTDELTGLPKREMLNRQLEAEVGRARRYGFSLALSILDIDNLDQINQQYGREAGDAVLSCYVREVLSGFRAYDFIARYGGDEFAIVFPNTPKDGAYRALEKARRCAADTVINHNGQSIPLPGFSSILTLYSQGEKPEVLLQRADEALTMAKLRGTGQILVSLPPQQ